METQNAHKRKKQPELIRRALLDEAARITLEQGLSKVTFQSVADAVGVTKGGVMHHFATKDALILEVFYDAMAKFEAEVNQAMAKDPVSYGSFTRAYIDATISLGEKGQAEFNSQATLYVLMLGDRMLRERWAEWSNEQLKNTLLRTIPKRYVWCVWLLMEFGSLTFRVSISRIKPHYARA